MNFNLVFAPSTQPIMPSSISQRHTLDNKEYMCGIFVDLQKVFYTVNHSILLHKNYPCMVFVELLTIGLNHIYPIDPNLSQFLVMNLKHFLNHMEFRRVLYLVPLIYLNDLNKAIKHSRVYHFADDTNLLNVSSSPKQMQKRINFDTLSIAAC